MSRWDRRTLLTACAVFLLLDILVAALLGFMLSRDRQEQHRKRDELALKVGITADMGLEEQEERFAIALGEASRLVTMRGEPQVKDGIIELYLSNSQENSCAVSVEISLLDSQRLLAACDLVEPGWRLEELELKEELEPGDYPCLVRCMFYTVDGNVFLGQTTRQVLLKAL